MVINTAILFSALFVIVNSLSLSSRYKLQPLNGIIITVFMINAGIFLTWNKNVRNQKNWYGSFADSSSYFVATISEPPVEKNKSLKALATVDAIIKKDSVYNVKGKLLLYFSKDSISKNILYGTRILIKKNLQEIKNSGNPAAFNYVRYCAFQQIFHQCFLKKDDWLLLKDKKINFFKSAVISAQHFVVNVLDGCIPGKDESALAKALLIGYKVDLDKDLVQAYSNAGVVHLIAISGLHLALIYALLLWFTVRVPLIKRSGPLRLIVILCGLWFFSILTGASASVLRSAVMFSFIAIGTTFKQKTSIYNSMASSAFVLLCINPFLLWDVGFQLSYCAVLGIVIAQRYIYNWFYFRNKLIDKIWKLASVSLSAQIFTLPICLYYFHQLPLLFLLSNVIAIPLATLVLWGCLFLVFVSPIHILAIYWGRFIAGLIWLLNHAVLFINDLPFSLWDRISISATETFILYFIIILFLYWLFKKNTIALRLCLYCTILFTARIAINQWQLSKQKKLIIYNVPAHSAMDFINGNTYRFAGDSELMEDGVLRNFHLKPARISFMLTKADDSFPLFQKRNFYQFYDKRILLIDSPFIYPPLSKKIHIDYIVISKNPRLFISKLAAVFNCGVYIFDGSNPLWKIDKWKKDCEELHLRFHSVPEQGAFVADL